MRSLRLAALLLLCCFVIWKWVGWLGLAIVLLLPFF